jgi:F-type H+-transporting ATPase subunit b
LEALGLNLGYLLVQVFNFLIIFVVLRAWVYKPVLNLLEQRRETIAQGLEDARVAAEARANAEEEAREIISEAQTEANQKVREATERAEKAAGEVRAEAENEITQAREAAMVEAREERERILGDMRGQVASLAMAAAQRIIGESLDEQRQHALIQEFFSGIRGGRVKLLEEAHISGRAAEVTSAVPLTDAEKETVREDVLSKIGSQATVTFRVDPAILGGLVIRVGDKVIDGSVASKVETLREAMV